jgi:endogenous inhibitor of DNA gyrase (YacG/DUF329 family)
MAMECGNIDLNSWLKKKKIHQSMGTQELLEKYVGSSTHNPSTWY